MGLLQDIINGATSGSTPVAQLLRSVQVLAVRGNVADLAEWVRLERDGYSHDDMVPTYRGPFDVVVEANFTLGPQMRSRHPLASTMFPEEFGPLFKVAYRQSIAQLEALNISAEQDLGSPWSGEAVHRANTLISRGGQVALDPFVELISVYRRFGATQVVGVVDAVRNRILDLALELEQVVPELDLVDSKPRESREQISAVFQTVVHAQSAYVGNNETSNHYEAQVTPGDTESLARYLDGIRGISDGDKKELVEAAEAAKGEGEEAVETNGRLKGALKKVGGFAGKASQEAGNIVVKAMIQHWLGPGA